ncbi:MAG: secretion protein F, partial [Lachnospiraceae bacterium]|nr:secretion protein F [Lachnospiraceae bacterium]
RRFGNRCQNSRYMKFATLLTQNVKAGSSGLKQLLKQEARLALEEQKNDARKKGEELSSKLLVPMMMQLFIVMVMIMIPVFLSF